MSSKSIYESIKKATVAIAIAHPETLPKKPFTIIGSGFCIHKDGVIVTCEHVFKTFTHPESYQRCLEAINEGKDSIISDLKGIVPHAIFFSHSQGHEIFMNPVPIMNAVAKTDFDLAAFKLQKHSSYSQGYPTLEIAEYGELYETMEVGTCGYPLGNFLQEQVGTVTSSFTKGMISSIIPAPNIAREQVRRFQLDLTATNGNSGGPVYSLATGKVFGVLQGGVVHPDTKQSVQGLSVAEPIYPLLENGLINRLAASVPMTMF